jgi:hypothetical protein
MNIRLNASPLCLAKNQAVTLTDARSAEIRCASGVLWITQDHDQRDIVLQAGESFTLDRGGPAIVWALAPSSAEVVAARRPSVLARDAGRQILRRLVSWPQPSHVPSAP